MPDSTPHIQQIRVESQTLPVKERVEQTSARGDITVDPCGGISITVSLDRPNEEITVSAEDVRDDNASFVYKKEGGSYDSTQTYGPFPEGEEVFFVKEQNKDCIFKVTKEVIHCDITITVDEVIDETYDDSTGEIHVSVSTASDDVEWAFDGGAWFSGGKTQEFTGLDDGTYLVEVRDEWGCKTNVMATVENEADTFAPSIPENITISDRSDGEAAVLDWDDSTDDETEVDKYKVYRSTTSGFSIGSSTLIATITGDPPDSYYEDEGVVDETTYYYKITAVDARDNESSPSTEKEYLFTDDVVPQAPNNLSGTVSDNTVSLDWDASASPDVDHYNVYRDGVKITEVAGGTTTYDDTGLTNGTEYDYYVTAVDEADNESASTSTIAKTPKDTTPPADPTGLSSSYDENNQDVNLTWDANTDDDFSYYKVYKSTQSGGPYNEIATNITSESYTDSIADSNTGTVYYYVVEAIDDDGLDSGYSNEVSVDTTLQIWLDQDWSYREKITIQSSEVNSDLTDFPVYVDLSDLSSDFFNQVRPGGGDIRITKADGDTVLPREIVSIDTSGNTGELHFKADSLSSSSNTEFWIYYGNKSAVEPAPDDAYGSENVWNDNYSYVSHDGGGTDSTSNNNNGSAEGGLIIGGSSGKVGNASDLDGQDDNIDLGSHKTVGSNSWTVLLWLNPDSIDSIRHITGVGSRQLSDYGILSHFGHSQGGDGKVTWWDESDGWRKGNTVMTPGNWYHAGLTYDGNSRESQFWMNGGKDGTGSRVASGDDAVLKNFGYREHSSSNDRYLDGILDEIRFSDIIRSDAWIQTEYTNQDAPSTFYSIGSQESVSKVFDKWPYRKKITVSSSEVNSDLTDFPVYADLSGLGSDFFDNVKSNGEDIRVTESDGDTLVPREVVSLDKTNETGELYFKASSLSSSSDTEFWIYYGNVDAVQPNSDSIYGSENVWSQYLFVSHDGGFSESTDSGLSLSENGDIVNTSGKLGDGAEYDGNSDYWQDSDPSDFVSEDEFTFSAWLKRKDGGSNKQRVYERGDTNDDPTGGLEYGGGSSSDVSLASNNIGGVTSNDGSFPDDGNFHHVITLVKRGATNEVEFHIDGSLQGTGSLPSFSYGDTSWDFLIGRRAYDSSFDYNGVMDELRMSKQRLSSAWASAEYINQSTPSTFYSVGSQESVSKTFGEWTYRQQITVQSSEVDADLTDFPVYVDLSQMSSGFFSNLNNDGSDIRVTTDDRQTFVPTELVNLKRETNVNFDSPDFSPRTDQFFSGTRSIGITKDGAQRDLGYMLPSSLNGGNQIEDFSFYYRETTDSYGSGVRLVDSSGNPVLGMATDNPEWMIKESSGWTQIDTGPDTQDYELWIKVEVVFDWTNGEATITFINQDDTSDSTSYTATLINNTDIEKIEFLNHASGSWQSGNAYNWYDLLEFTVNGNSKVFDFDEITGGELHFKAPNLSATEDTEFFLYYGNEIAVKPGSGDTYGSENVWSNGYEGVWHLEEDPTGTAPQMTDSSPKDRDGTTSGMDSSTSVESKIGRGLDFDASDDNVEVENDSSIVPDYITIIAWVKIPSSENFQYIVSNDRDVNNVDGFCFAVNYPGFKLKANDGNKYTLGFSSSVSTGVWNHLCAVYDGEQLKLFLNGSLDNTKSYSGTIKNSAKFNTYLGAMGFDPDQYITNAEMDEIKISNKGFSGDEISSLYRNQDSPLNFYSVGKQEQKL